MQYGKYISCLLLITSVLFARDEIIDGGILNGTVHWRGRVIIRGDVTIPSTGRLEVEPGTRILFEPNVDRQNSGKDKNRCELIIRGVMVAKGKLGQKVVFSSAAKTPRMADWYGIQIMNVKNRSILDYCIIEYGYDGISIKKSAVQISNSEIRYNFNSGIKVDVKASPNIARNIISENDYAGIICTLGARPVLTDNLITLNRIGLVIFSMSEPNLGSLRRNENYNPGRNRILNNEDYNLYNHSSKPISAENNSWGENRRIDIAEGNFDGNDDVKFGLIDFEPVFRPSDQDRRMGEFVLLAQNNPRQNAQGGSGNTPNIQSTNQPGGLRNSARDTSGSRQALTTNNGPGTNKENQDTTDLQIPNEIKLPDINENTPLLASSKPEETLDNPEGLRNEDIVNQIDYEQVFLEPFLDGGSKEYVSKGQIRVNEIIRQSIQPGAVRIKVIVDKRGRVENADVMKGINPVLDEAALNAIQYFRYKPGRLNGRPVRFSTMEVFVFK